ncbi:MAG: hypothetical protein K6A90_14210 [Lachnospiraceae bacterium]|nr:hypothetical protein [Lachnospiraceae bacterium]
MQNPFTTTFSKIPDYTYIPTSQTEDIIENFSFEVPSESVYKITGVRGSGKTVLLAKIERELGSEGNGGGNWLIYRLTTSRDMLMQLASMLYKESFIKKIHSSSGFNVSANILGNGAGVGISKTESEKLFDIGAELDEMLQETAKKRKKILIGIDEVSKTPEMTAFASEFGKWLRAGYPVYLVCTGLYENIEHLCNVNNLTFFRRATTVKTEPLNAIRMAEMYRTKLKIGIDEARRLSSLTKGYAYAFQELGILYFKKKRDDSTEDIIADLKTELFSYSYEKIWEEMTETDRALARLLTDKEEYKRSEITARMQKPNNYSVYRDRLLRRGIITSRQSYISLALPYFNDYIKDYCM